MQCVLGIYVEHFVESSFISNKSLITAIAQNKITFAKTSIGSKPLGITGLKHQSRSNSLWVFGIKIAFIKLQSFKEIPGLSPTQNLLQKPEDCSNKSGTPFNF